MINWFIARLREPSTHAALASFAAVAGFQVDETTMRDVLFGISAILGLLGVGLAEKGRL